MNEIYNHDMIFDLLTNGKKIVIYNQKVIDISDYIDSHPGGSGILSKYIGQDITYEMLSYNHSNFAYEKITKLAIGTTDQNDCQTYVYKCQVSNKSLETKNSFKLEIECERNLEEIYELGTHLAIKIDKTKAQKKIGQKIPELPMIMRDQDDKSIYKLQTPYKVSNHTLQLDIKLYPKGLGSNYLDSLGINEELEIMYSLGTCVEVDRFKKQVQLLLAAGSGITPIYTLATKLVLKDDKDPIDIFYAVRDSRNIMLLKELHELVQNNPQINVQYQFSKGYDKQDVQEHKQFNLINNKLHKAYVDSQIEHVKSKFDLKLLKSQICGPDHFNFEFVELLKHQSVSQFVFGKEDSNSKQTLDNIDLNIKPNNVPTDIVINFDKPITDSLSSSSSNIKDSSQPIIDMPSQNGRTKSGKSNNEWMIEKAKESKKNNNIKVTREELKKHVLQNDCWIAINMYVYDVTKYMHYHPGGAKRIWDVRGIDATQEFNYYHQWINAEMIMGGFKVGRLVN